jgi:hypothetical protein
MKVEAKISETIRVDQIISPVDIDTDRTGLWLPVTHYRRALAVVTTDTVAQTKNVTIQLMQATDAAGTNAKALSDVVTKVAPTGGAKLTLQVEAKSDELDEGFTHVSAKVTSDNGAVVNGAAVLIRGEGRYGVKMS